jgi:SagB-type dehydrogenase family enzyme
MAEPFSHDNFSKLFHRQSRASKAPTGDPRFWPTEWATVEFKEYERFPAISLSSPTIPKTAGLTDALKSRASVRTFDLTRLVSFEDFSLLLYNSAGIKKTDEIKRDAETHSQKRFYPSAGGKYSLEIYAAISGVLGIENGIYHYNVRKNSLERMLPAESLGTIRSALLYPWAQTAPILLIVTGVWKRTSSKYKDFGYRAMLLEAGYLGQNIQLIGAAIGIKTCPLIGFDNEKIDQLLDIVQENEFSLCITVLGK